MLEAASLSLFTLFAGSLQAPLVSLFQEPDLLSRPDDPGLFRRSLSCGPLKSPALEDSSSHWFPLFDFSVLSGDEMTRRGSLSGFSGQQLLSRLWAISTCLPGFTALPATPPPLGKPLSTNRGLTTRSFVTTVDRIGNCTSFLTEENSLRISR